MKRMALMILSMGLKLPYYIFKLFRMSNPKNNYSKKERYGFIHKLVKPVNRAGHVVVDMQGVENLPKDSGYIMYPNHQGLYDVLTLFETVDVPFSIVAKIETTKITLLHRVLMLLDSEFMDRSNVRQSMQVIDNVADRVAHGDSFVIFPEGTRSRKGNEMNPFKAGSFKAATKSHCPIVPVALVDSFVPFDSHSLKETTVHARILEPITYEEYKDLKTTQIAALVQSRIRDKMDEVIAEYHPEDAEPARKRLTLRAMLHKEDKPASEAEDTSSETRAAS